MGGGGGGYRARGKGESENNTWYCLVYMTGEGEMRMRNGGGESTVYCTVAAALEVVKKKIIDRIN